MRSCGGAALAWTKAGTGCRKSGPIIIIRWNAGGITLQIGTTVSHDLQNGRPVSCFHQKVLWIDPGNHAVFFLYQVVPADRGPDRLRRGNHQSEPARPEADPETLRIRAGRGGKRPAVCRKARGHAEGRICVNRAHLRATNGIFCKIVRFALLFFSEFAKITLGSIFRRAWDAAMQHRRPSIIRHGEQETHYGT